MKKTFIAIARTLTAAAALTAFAGCAGMGHKLEADKLAPVKKVVILGFEVQQKQPKDGFGFANAGDIKNGTTADSAPLKKMAADLYSDFGTQMAERTHWKVETIADLKANTSYAKLYHDKMVGARQVSMTGWNGTDNTEVIFADGAFDQTAFCKMKYEDKVALAKSFGADAFAEVFLYQSIKQGISMGNLVGKAAFAYQTRANLRLFGLNSPEPIWQIQNVDGEVSSRSSDLADSFTKREKLGKVGYESGASAISKLMADYPVTK